ncbi:uncharacterized protein RHIMIDRAFT_242973 [Rhizopus microsporus ATCC 52813]|uniref:Uncharacterized protein n=1 Tax=Rhizopus microsporus ATCC 52813 TaxID=1340429 RepID=A0A2G4SEF2_RHIZD|nr:uncharacterized protein RHIMIDRAFT_242973 [Rhizopus microsporus ATCC 52813]PHZ07171.1 hypothetical protein RHIMIDRAFT_242973 [Rhizopus microsporus ATCC 52813]
MVEFHPSKVKAGVRFPEDAIHFFCMLSFGVETDELRDPHELHEADELHDLYEVHVPHEVQTNEL